MKSLAELKFYNLNSVTQVIQNNKNVNQLSEDLFFYLVKNFQTNKNVDKQAIQKVFEDFLNLENEISFRANIFIGVYVTIFIICIVCFIPFLKAIKTYQKRVLLLIARIADGECQIESNKLSDILKYITNQNDSWVCKHFIIMDQQNCTDTQKRQAKSTIQCKTQKIPIQSKIKDQNMKSYKQMLIFILISFIGLSYFAIFILIIKQYSSKQMSYLDFFKFSQPCLLSFNSMIVDWSLQITQQQFKQYNSLYPQLDSLQIRQDYLQSSNNVKEYLVEFGKQIDKLSWIGDEETIEINELYTQSICNYYSLQHLCDQLPITTQQIYTAGLAELISHYLQTLQNFEILIQDDAQADIKQKTFNDYITSIDYIELILIRYNNTINFIYEIIQLNITSFDRFYRQFQKIHLLYFFLYGSFIILLFITMGFFLYQTSLLRMKNINFGLTCLPSSKISEESTLQMLKYIKKI